MIDIMAGTFWNVWSISLQNTRPAVGGAWGCPGGKIPFDLIHSSFGRFFIPLSAAYPVAMRYYSPTYRVHPGQSCGFPATLSSLHSTAFLTVPISRGPFQPLKAPVGAQRCLGVCPTVLGLGWRDRRGRLFSLCRAGGRTCRMVCRHVARPVVVGAGRSGGGVKGEGGHDPTW